MKYEKAYPRNKFSVRLKGPLIGKFKQTPSQRIQEIAMCQEVEDVLAAELERDDYTGELSIKISVNNYKDHSKQLSPWPHNAFQDDVTPESLPLD